MTMVDVTREQDARTGSNRSRQAACIIPAIRGAVISMSLFGPGVLAQAQDPNPGAIDEPSLQRELSAAYQRYEPSKKCWIKETDDGSFCLSLKSTATRSTSGGAVTLIVFASDNLTDNSHVAQGRLGLFVEKNVGGRVDSYTVDPGLPAGSFGSASAADVKVAKIGPDRWGWIIEEGDMHQGVSGANYEVVPAEAQSKAIALLPASYDDCGVNGPPCTSLEFKLSFDEGKVSGKFYRAYLALTGEVKGKRVPPERLSVRWDVEYPSPSDYYDNPAQFIKALRRLKGAPPGKKISP